MWGQEVVGAVDQKHRTNETATGKKTGDKRQLNGMVTRTLWNNVGSWWQRTIRQFGRFLPNPKQIDMT
jgi:hypothetical protein